MPRPLQLPILVGALAILSVACGPTLRGDACTDYASGAVTLVFSAPASPECPVLGQRTGRGPRGDSSGAYSFATVEGCPAHSACTIEAAPRDHGDLTQDFLCSVDYTETLATGHVECGKDVNGGGGLEVCIFWPDGGNPAWSPCQYQFSVALTR